MSRLSASWPVLAAALVLVLEGCYVGLDQQDGATASLDSSSSSSSTSTSVTTGAPDTSETGAEASTGGETGGWTSTGAVDGSTGEDTSTGEALTTEAEPSSGESGDETTGAVEPDPPPPPPPVDVPDNAYCQPVGNWDPAWAQLELDVLDLVNQVRAEGFDCKSKGVFAATGPLTMSPALRCAARKHSADMAARNYFSHTNPDGESPWDRMGKAGYGGYSNAGENIAAGSANAQGTMSQWLGSDGHCANIMSPSFKEIGVGYSTGGQYGHLWTQVFATK